MVLNETLTPAGRALVSMMSSVMGCAVGTVIMRGKDSLTPGLKRRETSRGRRDKASASAGSVLPNKSITNMTF